MIRFLRQNRVSTLRGLAELVIIVFGVLIALAVDEWRDDIQLAEQRSHILSTLLVDLEEDRRDYEDFNATSQRRSQAAQFLLSYSITGDSITGDSITGDLKSTEWTGSPGEAIFQLAYSARIQTTRSGFMEMISAGGRMAVYDDDLRSQILKYYSLATDRAAVNGFITPQTQRFNAALEAIGVSPSDRDSIDARSVMANPTASALVRTLGETAEFASVYIDDLVEANHQLAESIRRALDDE
jgi:Arc/MetJ family transcription regulator